MKECFDRGCPSEVDRDGYCRTFGHLCLRDGSTSATQIVQPELDPPTVAQDPGSNAGAVVAVTTERRGRVPAPQPPFSGSEVRDFGHVGTIDLHPMVTRDPAAALLADPSVPESRRFCSRCQQPVGRGRDGRPGRTEGFCPRDRTPFSFTPKLVRGMKINQFEILGCLAYGGVGWIYLARDLNLDGSWRVFKGLRDAGDTEAWEAMIAERRFLAQVDHPNIVKIYDFVRHPDPLTGTVAGYIVMEYVGGSSLQDILMSRRVSQASNTALPLTQVLGYGAEILTAFEYLHNRGLLYCDLKPANVIVSEDRLKLIDLGAVRRRDDRSGIVWGSTGFQAREVAISGPSIRSDLYSVGRTLAVLSLDVPNMSIRYPDRLPDPGEASLLRLEESYHRLLNRATHSDPQRRFATAAQMREQLSGVLREVLSATDGRPRQTPSTLFGLQTRSFGTDDAEDHPNELAPMSIAGALAVPLVNLSDPAASFLGTLGYPDSDEVIGVLTASGLSTVEVLLRLVRAHIESGAPDAASGELDQLVQEHPNDYRVVWYQGIANLAAARPRAAHRAFDMVFAMLPGELDAKLAYAISAELIGDAVTALAHYDRIWLTNRDYVSAAFGAARLRQANGDWSGAVDVLESVPRSSSSYQRAQMFAQRARLRGRDLDDLSEHDFVEAGMRIERLGLDLERRTRAHIDVLEAALRWVRAKSVPFATEVLGCKLNERELRFGLEREYRVLARLAQPRGEERIRLIDRANSVRPVTFL